MPATIDDLKKVIALADLPDDHLQWILDHSEYHEYFDGDCIGKYGETAEYMWIQFSGKVAFYMYINGRQVYYFTFENNHTTGGIGGLMPYSRMQTYPGYSYAVGQVNVLRMHKKYFHDLEVLNPVFIQKLIGYMTERARAFATMQLQREKVDALGNLAAGIAHELNNPAAAIRAISGELAGRLNHNYELTKSLLQCNVTPAHIQHIFNLLEAKDNAPAEPVKLTTMQRMEQEDEISDWLEDHGIRKRETAETFAEYGFTIKELETIHGDLGVDGFVQVIPWLENHISSHKIVKDLALASEKISHLVGAIKSHVHMDRSNDLQPTNIHEDIDNALTLLGFKLRAKNIEIVKAFCDDMPVVPAYVGELNQVWTNLIDNAIFALGKNGTLTIETHCNSKEVKVSVIDNGEGIPKDILSRIFDPFFTTKKVGEGTGIGLDVVNRIIKRHSAEIKVNSVPGRTEFIVTIPLQPKQESN